MYLAHGRDANYCSQMADQCRLFFSQDAHNSISFPTCSSRILPRHYQKIRVQCPLHKSEWVGDLLLTNKPKQHGFRGQIRKGDATSPGSLEYSQWMPSATTGAIWAPWGSMQSSSPDYTPEGETWPPDCSYRKPETGLPRLSQNPDPQKLNKMIAVLSC